MQLEILQTQLTQGLFSFFIKTFITLKLLIITRLYSLVTHVTVSNNFQSTNWLSSLTKLFNESPWIDLLFYIYVVISIFSILFTTKRLMLVLEVLLSTVFLSHALSIVYYGHSIHIIITASFLVPFFQLSHEENNKNHNEYLLKGMINVSLLSIGLSGIWKFSELIQNLFQPNGLIGISKALPNNIANILNFMGFNTDRNALNYLLELPSALSLSAWLLIIIAQLLCLVPLFTLKHYGYILFLILVMNIFVTVFFSINFFEMYLLITFLLIFHQFIEYTKIYFTAENSNHSI